MKPVKVNPIEGVLQFLGSGMAGPKEWITDKVGDITVDTSLPSDTYIWETGIERLSIEGKWVIVEQYPNKKKAQEGHSKWVILMKENPGFPLKDIDMWSLDT